MFLIPGTEHRWRVRRRLLLIYLALEPQRDDPRCCSSRIQGSIVVRTIKTSRHLILLNCGQNRAILPFSVCLCVHSVFNLSTCKQSWKLSSYLIHSKTEGCWTSHDICKGSKCLHVQFSSHELWTASGQRVPRPTSTRIEVSGT